ncbi:alpha/beta fold hydrolase [Roseibium sp. MMSF_3412]|uniref:alpha/beta fold hydrolase n=1 Tax=Roseibium sp. MMSF_3412 TaxID=3046712 RepID=UPI00273DCC85|nr:alpha/beta hydrolase [Roseibium sp. MMSF_3412]
MRLLTIAALFLSLLIPGIASAETRYGYETIDDLKIFFREAGDRSNPTIVMFHGFPSSSHQYRNLIEDLSEDYYVIAPDYPGFGASDFPAPEEFDYTFDNLADVVDTFLEQRGLTEYALVLHDYGAPVGFRIATEHPERVTALLVQNGNAYVEGVSADASGMLEALWQNRTPELEQNIIANAFSASALQWQYIHGTRNPDAINPDNWLLDIERMQRPGQHEMHLNLFEDYKSSIEAYPAWQEYLREHQPPVLVTWGRNDAFFTEAGAEAYARDAEDAKIVLYDTGHWPLEENGAEIATEIRSFLAERDIR